MKNIAILLAAGSGRRMGCDIPKQFMKVRDKMIIEYTIAAFTENLQIDEIAIVVSAPYFESMQAVVAQNGYHKVKRILLGGDERYLSSLAAIAAYKEEADCNLLIHDAARPMVSQRIISDVVLALQTHEAVTVAVSCSDTIYRVENKQLIEIPSRKQMMAAQTPQAFRLSVIQEAYRRGQEDSDFAPTDDCSVVLKYLPEQSITLVEGDAGNIKVTYPKDMDVLLSQLK